MDLDQIAPKVLSIVAETFRPVACALFEHDSSGKVRLLYSNIENRTLTPPELIEVDTEKFRLVHWLAEGFEAPNAYLGVPAHAVGTTVLDHATGTAVPEFDEFALGAGWDLELNIGVGSGGRRSSTLVIYRKRTDPFAPEEIALAESLATQLGLAVQYAGLAEEAKQVAVTREKEEAARTRAAELARANEVLRTTLGRFAASSDTGTFLESIVDEIAHQLGADGAHLALYDENTHTMRSAAGYAGHSGGSPQARALSPVISATELGAFEILRSATAPRFFDPATEADLFWPGTIEFHRKRGTRSVYTVPMHFGARFTGFLGFSFLRVVELSPERVELVQALAQQATLVVELLRLSDIEQQAAIAGEREKEAEARAAETQRINDFLSATLGSMAEGADLQRTVESILTGFAREIGAEHVFLFRYDAVARSIRLELSCIQGQLRRGLNGEEVPLFAAPFPADITPAWRIMTEVRGLFTTAMSPVPAEQFAWPGFFEYAERFGLSDAGHIVLFAGDEPVGSIGFALSNGRKLKPSDKPFIEGVARQSAIAIRLAELAERATLAAVAHEREAAAQERVEKLARTNGALKQTLDVVAFEPDFGQVPGKVLEAIASQLESPSSAFWLFDKKSGRYEVHLVYHEGKVMEVNEQTLPLLKGAWGRERDLFLKDYERERQPVVYQMKDLERSSPHVFACLDKLNIKSLLGVPLLLGAEILGSLTIHFPTQRELTPEELELTQAMAHQATLAIQLTLLADRVGKAALNEERARFAREIHDTLAQGFTGILMQLGAASQVPGDRRSDITTHIQAISSLARSNLAEARRSVRALRPLPGSECRLDGTVAQFVETARLQTKADVSFKIIGTHRMIPPHVENELCRIVQESLNNAVKHSSADRISVSVEFQGDDGVRLSVKDDGVGFDPVLRPAPDRFGLIGMRERAASIGASLTVVSEKNRGAEIIVQYGKAGS